MSLQLNINVELYRFTSSKPRFRDPLSAPEQLRQLPLLMQYFAAAPKSPVIDEITNAQPLVSALGAVHALANPLDAWQSFKGAFGFIGNRKGSLTP